MEALKHRNSKNSISKPEIGGWKYYLSLFLAFLFVDFPILCYFLFEIGDDLTFDLLYIFFVGGVSDLLLTHLGFIPLITSLFMMCYGVFKRRVHAAMIFLTGFILFFFACFFSISAGV
jgi:hypothetical protein